jgi:phenylacetate-coenzyme A ligase PaaK-like adenylate-forming protein
MYQEARLRALRDHAMARSLFYQQHHRGLAARPLHELPVVTKRMLMDEFDDFVTDRRVKRADVDSYLRSLIGDERFLDRYWVSSTSGTTGLRAFLLSDFDEWTTILASYARANEWAGVRPRLTARTRMAVVSSRVPWHQSARVGATLTSRFLPTLRLDATSPLTEIVSQLGEFQPEVLVAYASMGRLLAEEQIAGRLGIRPRAVMSASEVLTTDARERIRRAFGVSAFDVYAATETGGIASECEHHRMHLYEDLVITEAVDEAGRPVPPGTPAGRILVTVLESRTQPLIRYEMSDSIRLSSDVCPCGRSFALLESIDGRQEDVLSLGNVTVHPNVFHRALEAAPVAAWQIQEVPGGIRALVVEPHPGFDKDVLAASLRRELAAAGVPSAAVLVEIVAAIPKTTMGKAPLVRRQ